MHCRAPQITTHPGITNHLTQFYASLPFEQTKSSLRMATQPPGPSCPSTMRAWKCTSSGSSRTCLTLQSDVFLPSLPLMGSKILVKVSHASLNPADLAFMTLFPYWLPFRRHPVLGLDFSGTVLEIGSSLPPDCEIKIGSKVAGAISHWDVGLGIGTLTEQVVVDVGQVALVPNNVEWLGMGQAAGAMGIAGQTAVCMVSSGAIRKGMRVLVNGASGGVGGLVVQICEGLGCDVVGICSGVNKNLVMGLGAIEVIDYKAHQDLAGYITARFGGRQDDNIDVIMDCTGSQELYANSPKYLKPDGKFINIVGGWSQGVVPFVRNKLRPVILGGVPRDYILFLLSANGLLSKQVAEYLENGIIKKVPIDSEFGMEQAVEAYEKLATGRAKGKIIVKMAS
ncbi:hypothetical protein QBC36DRAFT_335923 [Triangularia setosa]|uniref:Enoyl reductase (ER) domain-containing protein n=1 Tax=Triangularia setosa TaxID=2587417 RepID=A0AAN7A2X0_9PEZI|nr:hypothetical protein QBC36DRAFT_335923 [Podospora setosa]